MPPTPPDDKLQALRARRALHPHPERVTDPLFQGANPFFDPHDVVQVKYEMLRRVTHDHQSVTEAVRAFGFTRPVFYQARRAFEKDGLDGLQHGRPGPQRRRKLNPEVLAFLQEARQGRSGFGARRAAREVRERFGLVVHPRSIERALRQQGLPKGGRSRKGPKSTP